MAVERKWSKPSPPSVSGPQTLVFVIVVFFARQQVVRLGLWFSNIGPPPEVESAGGGVFLLELLTPPRSRYPQKLIPPEVAPNPGAAQRRRGNQENPYKTLCFLIFLVISGPQRRLSPR